MNNKSWNWAKMKRWGVEYSHHHSISTGASSKYLAIFSKLLCGWFLNWCLKRCITLFHRFSKHWHALERKLVCIPQLIGIGAYFGRGKYSEARAYSAIESNLMGGKNWVWCPTGIERLQNIPLEPCSIHRETPQHPRRKQNSPKTFRKGKYWRLISIILKNRLVLKKTRLE